MQRRRTERKSKREQKSFFHHSSRECTQKTRKDDDKTERENDSNKSCTHQFLRVPSHSIEHSSHPVRLREPSLVRGHTRTRKFVRNRQFERFVGQVQRARVFEVRQGHFYYCV